MAETADMNVTAGLLIVTQKMEVASARRDGLDIDAMKVSQPAIPSLGDRVNVQAVV